MKSTENTNSYVEKLIVLLAKKTGINISKYKMDELVKGMFVELEHGSHNQNTNVTDDDPIQTFKIALAHLDELPDYYTRLNNMEKEAKSIKTENEIKKKVSTEQMSKRFKELCGIVENKHKKQLTNIILTENKKNILKEEIDSNNFDIIEFENDGLGKKGSKEEFDLYKMMKKKSNKN